MDRIFFIGVIACKGRELLADGWNLLLICNYICFKQASCYEPFFSIYKELITYQKSLFEIYLYIYIYINFKNQLN